MLKTLQFAMTFVLVYEQLLNHHLLQGLDMDYGIL